MWDWNEIKEHGGVTAQLLADMHFRAKSDSRKLDHNTYSRLYRYIGNDSRYPGLDCPFAYGRHTVDFYENEHLRRLKFPPVCIDCSVFTLKLHGNLIAQVWKNHIRLHTDVLARWATPTTHRRVSTVLAYAPVLYWADDGIPHIRLQEAGDTFRLNRDEDVVFDTTDWSSPRLWRDHELVQSEVVHPPLDNLDALPIKHYRTHQEHLFSINKIHYIARFGKRFQAWVPEYYHPTRQP